MCGGLPLLDTNMVMLNFPENDSFSGFWTYVQSLSGDICIFALTPHVSDELYQASPLMATDCTGLDELSGEAPLMASRPPADGN